MPEFNRNSHEKIKVEVTKYQDHDLINIRLYYEDHDGEYQPTRKGVTFRPEQWIRFRQAVSELEAELIASGLVDPDDLGYELEKVADAL